MIVLDEQLKNASVEEQISQWYRGRVVNITSLRPDTLIKDDAIPLLLRQVSDPIFVTINTTDFWEQIAAARANCITCFPLTDDRVAKFLVFCGDFCAYRSSKQARRGKVARVSHRQIQYYEVRSHQKYTLAWPEG